MFRPMRSRILFPLFAPITIALQSRLMQDFLTYQQDAARAASSAALSAKFAREDLDKTRKAGVKRVMARVISAEAEDQETADRLFKEAYEDRQPSALLRVLRDLRG
jgi:hypothetical protein